MSDDGQIALALSEGGPGSVGVRLNRAAEQAERVRTILSARANGPSAPVA